MDKQNQNSKKPKKYNSFIKYSGLAIQMLVVIYFGNLLGIYLDDKFNPGGEMYTKLITLVAVFLSTFMVIRQVITGEKNND